MLISITRNTFEELIPTFATGSQYQYYWGKFPDVLRRLLISVIGGVIVLCIRISTFGQSLGFLFIVGITVGTYWLWGPIFWASRRNIMYRKYPYSGFWQGRVLDVFVTDDVIGTEETVNDRGELVIVENRERRLNLEVGDESGFQSQLQVPIRREYRSLDVDMVAQMLVVSNKPDLSRIAKTSDIYIPSLNLWVSDYPYLRRDLFVEVSRKLRDRRDSRRRRSRTSSQGTRIQ